MKALSRVLFTLCLALALDGISKIWAERTLELYQPVPIGGEFFRFTLGYNTGVAFGMFANGGLGPLVVTGLVILGLIVWFTRALRSDQFSQQAGWPIGLLLGGAIANFADRLIDNRVTDFLDVGLGAARWPTFNLADSFIIIGMAWLLLISYGQRRPLKEIEQPGESTSAGES
jgi:signal peptidase II